MNANNNNAGLNKLFNNNNAANPTKKGNNTGRGNNQAKPFQGTKWMGIILVGIFMIILIAVVYMKSSSGVSTTTKYEPILITSPVNAYDANLSKTPANIPNPTIGLEYTYSFWIYVSDYTYKYGQWKRILTKGDTNGVSGVSPDVALYPNTNALQVRLSTTMGLEGADVQNIPLKKWNHIVILLNGRSLDVYINGFLERSVVFKGIPIMNNSPLSVCKPNEPGAAPGFYGQISRLQYFARAISTSEISALYQAGPYGSASKSYNVLFFNNGNIVDYSETNPNSISTYNTTTESATS
jgi:hypothetical protein